MSLMGKLEMETEIKSAPAKFHEVVSCRPHHLSNVCPDKVQNCALHEGEFGNAGAVIIWSYVHDGKTKVTKEIIEDIDDEKNLTTFKVVEGDLTEEFKSFKFIVEATPKGEGSMVHWSVEYEKMNEAVPDPKSILQFVVDISKDIDAHLCQQA